MLYKIHKSSPSFTQLNVAMHFAYTLFVNKRNVLEQIQIQTVKQNMLGHKRKFYDQNRIMNENQPKNMMKSTNQICIKGAIKLFSRKSTKKKKIKRIKISQLLMTIQTTTFFKLSK